MTFFCPSIPPEFLTYIVQKNHWTTNYLIQPKSWKIWRSKSVSSMHLNEIQGMLFKLLMSSFSLSVGIVNIADMNRYFRYYHEIMIPPSVSDLKKVIWTTCSKKRFSFIKLFLPLGFRLLLSFWATSDNSYKSAGLWNINHSACYICRLISDTLNCAFLNTFTHYRWKVVWIFTQRFKGSLSLQFAHRLWSSIEYRMVIGRN